MSDGTVDVRAGEEVDVVALREWLAEHAPSYVPAGCDVAVRQFPSGFSNLTYLLSLSTEDGARALVLRRPPRGVKPGVAHDVLREFGILSALYPLGVPVPPPVASCDDVSIIGTPFYVMAHVDGVILRGKAPAELVARAESAPSQLTTLSETFVATLADRKSVV